MSDPHTHIPRAGRRNLRPLTIAFGLVVVFMAVEAVAGFLTGSLALISDAGHMATDALGLGMALAAIVAADRAAKGGHTYGLYRLEILAALANAVLLIAVAGFVIYEAAQRFLAANRGFDYAHVDRGRRRPGCEPGLLAAAPSRVR